MKTRTLAFIVLTLCILGPCGALAQTRDCVQLLSKGVFEHYNISTETDFKSRMQKLFSHSYERVVAMSEEEQSSLGISALVKAVLVKLTGSHGEKRSQYESLREKFFYAGNDEIENRYKFEITRSIASDAILKAFNECMQIGMGGLTISAHGLPLDYFKPVAPFLASIDYTPRTGTDRDVVIKDFTYAGANPIEPIRFKKGAVVQRFSGLSQTMRREGAGPVSFRVDFEGAPSVVYTAAELKKPRFIFRLKAYLAPTGGELVNKPQLTWDSGEENLSAPLGHVLQYDVSMTMSPKAESTWKYIVEVSRTIRYGDREEPAVATLSEGRPSALGVNTRISNSVRGVLEIAISESAFDVSN